MSIPVTGQGGNSTPPLTALQVAQLAFNAGWRGPDLIDAIWTAGIESSFIPNAVSPTGCCGLWQLCPCTSSDPQQNANDAFKKWQAAGNTFSKDWWAFDGGTDNPNYQKFANQAIAAVAQLPTSSTTQTQTTGVDLNPLDAIGSAISSVANAWQTAAIRVYLVFLGVIVVSVGIFLLVKDDIVPVAETTAEVAAL